MQWLIWLRTRRVTWHYKRNLKINSRERQSHMESQPRWSNSRKCPRRRRWSNMEVDPTRIYSHLLRHQFRMEAQTDSSKGLPHKNHSHYQINQLILPFKFMRTIPTPTWLKKSQLEVNQILICWSNKNKRFNRWSSIHFWKTRRMPVSTVAGKKDKIWIEAVTQRLKITSWPKSSSS